MNNIIEIYYQPKKHKYRKTFIFYPLVKRDIMASSSSTRALNLLEKTVLHLFLVELSRERIGQTLYEIGMNKDMRDAIILRLRSRGLLEGNRVTAEGRERVLNSENEKHESLEPAFIFQDPFTGEVVPFYGKMFILHKITKEQEVTFNAGDEGEPVELRGIVIDPPGSLNRLNKPTPEDVRDKCRDYARKNRKHPVYYLEVADHAYSTVYLPIEVFIEKEAYDWRVADPFNDSLSNYWKRQIERLYSGGGQVKDLIDRLTGVSLKEQSLKNNLLREKVLESYNFPLKEAGQNRLIESLIELEKSYAELDSHSDFYKVRKNYFSNVILVLENALDIVISPYINEKEPEKYLKKSIYCSEQIIESCRTLNFTPIRIKIPRTAIKRFIKEKSGNIQVRIFFLLLLQNSLPQLKRLADTYQDWLVWIINRVSHYRNESLHDSKQEKEPLIEEIEESRQTLEKSLQILLGIKKVEKVIKVSPQDENKIVDAKNSCREFYKGSDQTLKSYLCHLEMGKAVEARKCLEYLLKQVIRTKTDGHIDISSKLTNDEWRDELNHLAQKWGFSSYPQKLTEINKRNIPLSNKKIDKKSAGGLSAYILLAGIDLEQPASREPQLFESIQLIVDLAPSHSKKEPQKMDYEEYKAKIYKVIEVLEAFLNES